MLFWLALLLFQRLGVLECVQRKTSMVLTISAKWHQSNHYVGLQGLLVGAIELVVMLRGCCMLCVRGSMLCCNLEQTFAVYGRCPRDQIICFCMRFGRPVLLGFVLSPVAVVAYCCLLCISTGSIAKKTRFLSVITPRLKRAKKTHTGAV